MPNNSGAGLDIASQSGQEDIADAIRNSFNAINIYMHNTHVEESEQNAANAAIAARSYLEGGTGTREGEDTDNVKYFYQTMYSDDITDSEIDAMMV